jgi:preprotein translocase subunit YajC
MAGGRRQRPFPRSWSKSLITPAFAQGIAGPSGDMILQFVPFVLIFVIMWFLIIRPQQRRVKDHREMINNVRRGDTVVTSGGIVGKVTRVFEEANELEVEIADGVKVKLVRGMIAEVRTKGEPVKS